MRKPATGVIRLSTGGWKYSDARYESRFWERVRRLTLVSHTGCWLWQGKKHPKGYAVMFLRGYGNMNAHRAVYIMRYRVKLTTEQFVCHSCDTRHCLNPAHLWVGTAKDNNQDCASKGRHHNAVKTHCPKGHPYDERNTYLTKKGLRDCKACNRERQRRAWRENRA